MRYQLRYIPYLLVMQRYNKKGEEKNFLKIFSKIFARIKKMSYLCTRKREQNVGAIAQLVEQRTENPCVPGSIPGGTTKKIANS